jgi:hypothetical protein
MQLIKYETEHFVDTELYPKPSPVLPTLPITEITRLIRNLSYQERIHLLKELGLPAAKYLEHGISLIPRNSRINILWMLGLSASEIVMAGFSRLSAATQRAFLNKLNALIWGD